MPHRTVVREGEPPEPLKICAFYHSVTPPSRYYLGTAYYMRLNGYTIGCGFVPGWDKDFANPTIPWTLPISETDEFDEHEEWITIQIIMKRVFFEMEQQIMLQYLIGSLYGLNWKNVLLAARDTIRDYFRDNNITRRGQTAWWLSLQARGLDIAIDPSSGIDLDTITPPRNPLG